MTPLSFQFRNYLIASYLSVGCVALLLTGCNKVDSTEEATTKPSVNRVMKSVPTQAKSTAQDALSSSPHEIAFRQDTSPHQQSPETTETGNPQTSKLQTGASLSLDSRKGHVQAADPDKIKPQHALSSPKKKPTGEHEYEPPFGERTNLFLPVRGGPSKNRTQAKTAGSTIQLKGFARTDQLRAILTHDGHILTLSEGEEKEGILAIQVQPPQVQLQKGRRRWTLSLETSK